MISDIDRAAYTAHDGSMGRLESTGTTYRDLVPIGPSVLDVHQSLANAITTKHASQRHACVAVPYAFAS